MRRTAKIIVIAIQLACPVCKQVVAASNGAKTLHKDVADERWELLQRESYECPGCYARFRLPSNPFRIAKESS
jgi:hypothetical protein